MLLSGRFVCWGRLFLRGFGGSFRLAFLRFRFSFAFRLGWRRNEIQDPLAGIAINHLFALYHVLIDLRAQDDAADRAHLVFVHGRQYRVPQFHYAVIVAKSVVADVSAKLPSLGIGFGQRFLVLGGLLARVFFFLLVLGGGGLERNLCQPQFFLARVGGDHDLEDLVFKLADLG